MTLADVDALWWSAFVGGVLWGVILTAICIMLIAAVRLWNHERQRRKPGRL